MLNKVDQCLFPSTMSHMLLTHIVMSDGLDHGDRTVAMSQVLVESSAADQEELSESCETNCVLPQKIIN